MADFVAELLRSERKALQRKILRRRKALEEAEKALQELEKEMAQRKVT